MSRITLRVSASRSIQALVVISPATIATPVLTMVSQATRARLSWARIASSTASEIWSAILSGWPSETDSEVKRVLDIGLISLDSDGKMGANDTPPHRPASSEEHTSELQSLMRTSYAVIYLKKKK